MIGGVLTFAYWHEGKRKVIFRLAEPVKIGGYEIPAGYETDFATVPRLFFSIIPPIGKHNVAAILHDFLYDNRIGTRKRADKLFLCFMLSYNVPKWQAYTMYYAVRLGGRKWWNN
jgi:hypothetical protein